MVNLSILEKIPVFTRDKNLQQEKSFSGIKERKYQRQYNTIKKVSAEKESMFPQ